MKHKPKSILLLVTTVSFLILAIPVLIMAQSLPEANILLPACPKKRSCGYIDQKGKFIIKPRFLDARNFNEGLAAVKVQTETGERFGYIDSSGTLVIPATFEASDDFSNGLAWFGTEVSKYGFVGKYGFIDRKGNIIVPANLAHAQSFSEGLAMVTVASQLSLPEDQPKGLSYKVGFLNIKGEFAISPQFYIARSFSEGLAVACVGKFRSSKCGYIDKSGTWAIKPVFADAESFSEGLAAIEVAGKWGFIDKSGMVVVEPQFSVAKQFSEGLAAVGKPVDGNTYGYIDKTGMPMIPFIYASAGNFSEGLAAVEPKGLDEFRVKYFYIDREGRRNSKKEYIYAFGFQNGIATVGKANVFARLDSGPLLGLAVGKRCYIDKSEKMFWEERE